MNHTNLPVARSSTLPIPAGTFHANGVIICSRCGHAIAASRYVAHLRGCRR
ncbi:MAG: hypothetical protein HZY73_12345 [Micropruina sp.]|nr:MAG: hypothetical protein HZY73_12345 [Micropruina sp.]